MHLQELRRLIESKKRTGLTEGDLVLFGPAWTWEVVVAGGSGREAFLKTVNSDLMAVRALALYDSPQWPGLIRHGYERVLKDKAALASFHEEILTKAPRSQSAWWIEDERTRKPGGSCFDWNAAIRTRG